MPQLSNNLIPTNYYLSVWTRYSKSNQTGTSDGGRRILARPPIRLKTRHGFSATFLMQAMVEGCAYCYPKITYLRRWFRRDQSFGHIPQATGSYQSFAEGPVFPTVNKHHTTQRVSSSCAISNILMSSANKAQRFTNPLVMSFTHTRESVVRRQSPEATRIAAIVFMAASLRPIPRRI